VAEGTHLVQVVLSSTCATYGVPEKITNREEHQQRLVNPYGFSKPGAGHLKEKEEAE
jgi:UDP-glucose 4-epimerase